MADVYGIQNTLVSLIAGVIYPNGTSQPSVSGVTTTVYAGWPQPARLEQDLTAGGCHITVYPLDREEAYRIAGKAMAHHLERCFWYHRRCIGPANYLRRHGNHPDQHQHSQ